MKDFSGVDNKSTIAAENQFAQEAVIDSPIFTYLFNEKHQYAPGGSGVLNGKKVSIKATFDVKGYATTGGCKLLGNLVATEDAEAVKLLKEAGARCVGHTNMTELAYSGLGLNPHFGTPENPIVKGAIPGGSTSGGAVSVAKGYADIALGTDTGGSLRIPAAFCGLTGFKPSQYTVSRKGCLPLSDYLDSVGPIASTVKECRIAWEVMSKNPLQLSEPTYENVEFIVPSNFGFDGIDSTVLSLFKDALVKIKQAGFNVTTQHIDLLDEYKKLPIWHFSAVESRRHYGKNIDLSSDQLDPRVKSRIERGLAVSDEAFEQTCEQRDRLIKEYETRYKNVIFVLPTVACEAPRFEDLLKDSDYDHYNLLCLRNTSMANVLNGCSISLPHQFNGLTAGVMLNMTEGQDECLLSVAERIESLLNTGDKR
ncbi:amidase family protein [uncultured Vibrio sp.]|uniref:amidase family protein n=1 Tax=uncultured Vibrio sp. TaxID=114054 RepID=UPI0025F0EC6C|nr:amidase family protein [uncultured Vibrio sp.]